MVISAVINGETLSVGDEITVKGNKKEVFYISNIVLDRLDRVKDIYAVDSEIKKVIQVNKEGYVRTGRTVKMVQRLRKELEK